MLLQLGEALSEFTAAVSEAVQNPFNKVAQEDLPDALEENLDENLITNESSNEIEDNLVEIAADLSQEEQIMK